MEQDRLDGLHRAVVDVVALSPEQAAPHVELLGYQTPPGHPAALSRPQDIAATRLVLEVDEMPAGTAGSPGVTSPLLLRDPDGHMIVLVTPGG